MTAQAESGRGGRALVIRGRSYPVLLPKLSDPRLQLAATITSLQVLGQVAFDFKLSIAQILVSLGTCAILEVGIAFFRQHVVMWPASALLTGNGVAFVLRVPGTEHGDWWSMNGWWIFAGTAAVSLLSKYLIQWRGRHIFNPSNFGLVLCFLILGKDKADPLEFWWGPMSPWMAAALLIIVGGGILILRRVRLLAVAVAFWIAFGLGIGLLSLRGHAMTASWHLGPITGLSFWLVLITSPEVLVFTFFMITDPRTVPLGRAARLIYAVSLGLLATLLIAPQTTEFGAKVALLGSLTLLCAARPLLEWLVPEGAVSRRRIGLAGAGGAGLAGAVAFAGLLVLAGLPARPSAASAAQLSDAGAMPRVTVLHSDGVSTQLDERTASVIAGDLVADLRTRADALRLRDAAHASTGIAGSMLADVREQIASAQGHAIVVPSYSLQHVTLRLRPGTDQGPPTIVAQAGGLVQQTTYSGAAVVRRESPSPFAATFELGQGGSGWVIVGAQGAGAGASSGSSSVLTVKVGGLRLRDVAKQVGLDFRQGSFRYGMSNDVGAMMGGGLCWLDVNGDGWQDLFVVNSYSDDNVDAWAAHGGLPTSQLFENEHGHFVNVTRRAHAGLAVKGNGCVAADLNGDGRPDLVVTTTDGIKLLWNNGNGTFTEGARAAGMTASGWYTGVAVADVNGDGRPDVFVAGYTDLNDPVEGSTAGFPTRDAGVRDLLYLNEGGGRFREVGVAAGLESAVFSHGLGAEFIDYNGDGRPDLYVANDEDPNQLYENVPWPGGAKADPAGLGFRFEERGAAEGVADPYAGMGIADTGSSLFVSNSRREPSAAYAKTGGLGPPAFRSVRSAFVPALGTDFAGWGASWVDLANSGTPSLALAAGAIPVTQLSADAEPVRILAAEPGATGYGTAVGLFTSGGVKVNGRGLAAADVDNNGRMEIAINTIGGNLVLLRPTGKIGHWLDVKLDAFSPGATVTAVLPSGKTLVRTVQAGSSYLSSEDPRVHFGLGGATSVRSITVRYPGGAVTRLANVRGDRVVSVARPVARTTAAVAAQTSYALPRCTPSVPAGSVAHVWDQAAISVLRIGLESEPVQARDLFHLSAAMWDAWAAYDPAAAGYVVNEKARAANVPAARNAAISYAAYRLLLWRASYGSNLDSTFANLTSTMTALCYSTAYTTTKGDSPAALGNRIAAAFVAYGQRDGSLERQHYVDPSYVAQNAPLVVSQPGSAIHDPTLWQPLALGQTAVQGLAPIPAKVQSFDGAQWGHVRPFASRTPKAGAPPLGDATTKTYKRAAVAVIRAVSTVPPAPIFAPSPIEWNLVANGVAHSSLEHDVKLYFALNAALHDAAIAAWGAKRAYQAPRPISMIRYAAFQGQSSDPKQPSYNAEGLPLVPGLVELITSKTKGPLAADLGQVAVKTRTGWVLGTRWTPLRQTPASPGWVSGDSAFAYAAVAVLGHVTGAASFVAAAQNASASGLEAGIDIPADDEAGARLGTAAGKSAWSLAQRYFSGAAGR
ncbi:MAG TPA: FG-GAP-like repeat-containing protein [Gaiellaceae bacterium]|nr:FG-GAP-like repeat-containing protein [Gaiellaceae bacterium]